MGERVRKNLFRANNIVVTCCTSGKLTTSLVQYWIDNCLCPYLSHSRTLLLSDSWGGQRDQPKLYNNVNGLARLSIPNKTTSKIQPLDVFFNRQ